jgi:hypothetical protein
MPPDTAERRPRHEGGALDDAHGGGITIRVTAPPMRRRRQAARRFPPLASGHRGPLDALAGLPVPGRPCCRAVLGPDGRWRACCGHAAAA